MKQLDSLVTVGHRRQIDLLSIDSPQFLVDSGAPRRPSDAPHFFFHFTHHQHSRKTLIAELALELHHLNLLPSAAADLARASAGSGNVEVDRTALKPQ